MEPDQDNNQQQNNQTSSSQPQQQQPQQPQTQPQPQVQSQPQPQQTMSQQTNYAGFWIRFLAVFIDSIILFIPSFIIGGILGGAGLEGVSNIVGFAIGFGYFTYLESSERQATFGKQALNLKVTDENGQRIDFTKASVRYLSKILSGLILFIGYIMAGFDSKKQSLHDKIASTYVVKA